MLWNRGRDDAALRFLQPDRPAETLARLALVAATAVVIRSGLAVMGVAPGRGNALTARPPAATPTGDRRCPTISPSDARPIACRARAGMDPATRRLALIAAGLGGALLVLIGAWSMTGGHRSRRAGGRAAGGAGAGEAGQSRRHAGRRRGPGDLPATRPAGATPPTGGVMPPPETPDLAALRAPPRPPPAATALPRTSPGAPATGPAPGPAIAPAVAPATSASSAALPLPPIFPTRLPQAARAIADRSAIGAPGMAPPTPRPLAVPTTSAGAAGASAGAGAQVQLAALPTRAAAVAEWHRLRLRMPGLLVHHRLVLAEARVGGHVWWRVRTAGFADPGAARQFCARARAAGVACDVTSF